jgi:tripartite ATP-independent transporter DctM subunit
VIAWSFLVLLILLITGIPVAATILGVAFFVDVFFSAFPLSRALGEVLWSSSDSFLLIAIPLFVLLGEILVETGVARSTYQALEAWLSWLPGGLIHANIGTAAFFAATSGSSVATAATVGTIAMPQARTLGYDERLFAGSIAAGGTLGIMIPPSINLIVYGFLTQTSVPQLFVAGLAPGVLLALLFIVCTATFCILRPSLGGPRQSHDWSERFRGLWRLVPILVLFLLIVGSIYLGWATPTEAAAVGVVGAALIAACMRRLTLRVVVKAVDGTMRTTAMLLLIIMAAYFLNFVLASSGVTNKLDNFIQGSGLGTYGTLFIIVGLYLVLGCFIETLSLMVITIPIVTPIVVGLGFDPVWFGILLILLIEMALITPPMGLNLYVVQGVRQHGSLNDVMAGAAPYVALMLMFAVVLIFVPQLALFLPSLM